MNSVIEAFKRDVDRTILRENLRLTPEQRIMELMDVLRAAEEFERAGRPRDLQAVADLEALLEEQARGDRSGA